MGASTTLGFLRYIVIRTIAFAALTALSTIVMALPNVS